MGNLLEAEDVAAMLGMSKDWIYGEVRADRIPHVRLGRYVRFRQEAIDGWILERERGKMPST
jgi:excisionase family DNA binding protein